MRAPPDNFTWHQGTACHDSGTHSGALGEQSSKWRAPRHVPIHSMVKIERRPEPNSFLRPLICRRPKESTNGCSMFYVLSWTQTMLKNGDRYNCRNETVMALASRSRKYVKSSSIPLVQILADLPEPFSEFRCPCQTTDIMITTMQLREDSVKSLCLFTYHLLTWQNLST